MTTRRLTAAAALHLGIPMTESIDEKLARLAQKVFAHLQGNMSATFSWQGSDADSYTLALKAHNQKTIDLIAADIRTELSAVAVQGEAVIMPKLQEPDTTWRGSFWGDRVKFHSTDQIHEFAAARVKAAHEIFTQAVTDLENQPSQYGTVTLDYHLEKIKQWEDRFERAINIRTTPQPAPTVQGEVVAYLRFWAAQQVSPDGGVEADEGYEVCKKNDIGADGYLAFPVYATPQLGIAQPKQDNYDSLINSVKMQSAAQAGLVAGQEYDSVTRESAENAIEYMSSYNGRGREVDAQAMLVTTPPPPSIGGEVTDAWQEINSMNLNDDLVWLRKGNNIDGPRPPEPEDYDRYEFWVLCESPSIASTSTKPAQQPLQDAKYAERYRWLREQPIDGKPGNPVIAVPDNMHSGDYVNGDDADQAIDAAIASQKGTQ